MSARSIGVEPVFRHVQMFRYTFRVNLATTLQERIISSDHRYVNVPVEYGFVKLETERFPWRW